MLLELGGVRLVTDPVLRARVAHLRRHGPAPEAPQPVDAVLLSHLHYDHLDLPSLRRLGRETPVIAPRGAARMLRDFRSVREVLAGDVVEVGDVAVEVVRAEHDERRRPLGPRARPIGFVASSEHSVYFAGDTAVFPEMAALRPVDVALLPVAGWGPKLGPGHLDPEQAARAAALLRPRIAIPIHWGTLHPRLRRPGGWFSDPPHSFAAHVEELASDVEVRVLAPGESLEL